MAFAQPSNSVAALCIQPSLSRVWVWSSHSCSEVSSAAAEVRKNRLLVYWHNLLGWTITAIVCLIRDRIWLQVAPNPSTGNRWPPAGTVQRPFICESFSQRHQVRPVTVRAEARQISSQAFWTLNAMANTGSHGMWLVSSFEGNRRTLTPPATADHWLTDVARAFAEC